MKGTPEGAAPEAAVVDTATAAATATTLRAGGTATVPTAHDPVSPGTAGDDPAAARIVVDPAAADVDPAGKPPYPRARWPIWLRRGFSWPIVSVGGGLLMSAAFPPFGIWPLALAGVALVTLAIRERVTGHHPGRRGQSKAQPGQEAAIAPAKPVSVALLTSAIRERATGRFKGRSAGLVRPVREMAITPVTRPSFWRTVAAGAWPGLLAGLAFFLVLLDWAPAVGMDAWLVLSGAEAVYFALLGVGLAAVSRLPGWPLWSACLWVAEEFARNRFPLGGFPWGRLAFSQASSPFTPYAALGGAPLVTFVTALAGGLLAAAVAGGRHRAYRFAAAGAAVLVGLVGLAVPVSGGGRVITVAVVQGNVPRLGLDFLGQAYAVLDNHVQQVHRLASLVRSGQVPRPSLVLLPENASDVDPYQDARAYELIDSAARDVGVPVLIGAATYTPDGHHLQNRGIVWSPRTGPGEFYVKRHLVPFGEYVPFSATLRRFITELGRVPLDYVPGNRPGTLPVGSVTVGDVICFEVADDGIVRDAVSGGATPAGGAGGSRGRRPVDVITVQTNNATYGNTSQPPQQLAIERLRAVEHGRPVLIAATSGISAVVAADGTMMAQSRQFTPALLVERVRVGTGRTLADRLGAMPEWLLMLAGVCAAAAGAVRGARRRRSQQSGVVNDVADQVKTQRQGT